MLSQEHFIGYVTTTSNNTFTNNFETNGAIPVHMFALNLSVVPWKEILSHIALRVLRKFAKILEIIAF